MDSISQLLNEAAQRPLNSPARIRLEKRVLNETGITNMNQVAGLVEAVALHEALFAQAQTISAALRQMHELIQIIA